MRKTIEEKDRENVELLAANTCNEPGPLRCKHCEIDLSELEPDEIIYHLKRKHPVEIAQ